MGKTFCPFPLGNTQRIQAPLYRVVRNKGGTDGWGGKGKPSPSTPNCREIDRSQIHLFPFTVSKGLGFNKGVAPLLLFLKLDWVGTLIARTGANPGKSVIMLAAANVCYLQGFWHLSCGSALTQLALLRASACPHLHGPIYFFNVEHLFWECRVGSDTALSRGTHSWNTG